MVNSAHRPVKLTLCAGLTRAQHVDDGLALAATAFAVGAQEPGASTIAAINIEMLCTLISCGLANAVRGLLAAAIAVATQALINTVAIDLRAGEEDRIDAASTTVYATMATTMSTTRPTAWAVARTIEAARGRDDVIDSIFGQIGNAITGKGLTPPTEIVMFAQFPGFAPRNGNA